MLQLGLLYQNGMILQRKKEIKIVGNTTPMELISGVLGEVTSTATADENGDFTLCFPAMEAATNLTLTVSNDTEEVMLSSIDVGDIYLACGQSNMEFFRGGGG